MLRCLIGKLGNMKKAIIPLIVAIALAVGILVGNLFAVRSGVAVLRQNGFQRTDNKITDMLSLIDQVYVDSVQSDSLVELVMPLIVRQLDPHSAYIPASDLVAVNEELAGSFGGIGVQFSLQNDTIHVVEVIAGGPSERAGLQAGDRIVEVNDTAFVGSSLTNERVMKRLRGPKNTQIKLGIVRAGSPDVLHFDIIRGDIPSISVYGPCMVAPKIGYINVSKFGADTYWEFLTALSALHKKSAQAVIIDLRGNSGGYLDAATNMLNEFLAKNDLLVYVEGKAYPRESTYANGNGTFTNMKIAVLVDEFSASASEIFAGAIQDNDRGVIIGRRTFGKGLVQNQMQFADGSALRLTVARYYTPSGRCIQKPYERGKIENYEEEMLNRYLHGEMFSQDSIHQNDTVAYHTKKGRTVYGGGGIMPDIFVARDTTGYSPYFAALANGGHIYQFALQYTEQHRETLKKFGDWQSLTKHLDQQKVYDQLVAAAIAKGITGSDKDKSISQKAIQQNLYSYIIRNVLGDIDFYSYAATFDTTILRAVEELNN